MVATTSGVPMHHCSMEYLLFHRVHWWFQISDFSLYAGKSPMDQDTCLLYQQDSHLFHTTVSTAVVTFLLCCCHYVLHLFSQILVPHSHLRNLAQHVSITTDLLQFAEGGCSLKFCGAG